MPADFRDFLPYQGDIMKALACAFLTAASAALLPLAPVAAADITVGITTSATGPASALGIPQKNTVALLPPTLGGLPVRYVLLDDATDPTQASKNARRFVEENKVDVVLGSSTVSNTLALVDVIGEHRTPLISLSPVVLPAEKERWVFRVPQHNGLMVGAIADDMKAAGVASVAMIGFADPFGESFMGEMRKALDAQGIKVLLAEKYNRNDTSVMGQVMKILAVRPDAVLVAASGTPSVLPHVTLVERGYKGRIYQSHGAIGRDVLRVGGKAIEGGLYVTGPVVVGSQLPDSHPMKPVILDYVKRYEARYGADSLSPHGGLVWDAYLLLDAAAQKAKDKAAPGTVEFRQALRDALEGTRDVVGVYGVYNMSSSDHFGHDERARVLVRVENGAYRLVDSRAP